MGLYTNRPHPLVRASGKIPKSKMARSTAFVRDCDRKGPTIGGNRIKRGRELQDQVGRQLLAGSDLPILASLKKLWYNARYDLTQRNHLGMTSLNEIITAAQALPPSDRAQLIASLWEKSSPEEWVIPDAKWIAECNRRSDAFETGEISGSSWTDVRERARREAGLDG